MSKIKIKTLTSVHIGSGDTLQYGTDFVPTMIGEDYYLSVVDPRKVLSLIGEANLYQWVSSIEKMEATSNVVKRFAPNADVTDYSERLIRDWSAAQETDTLKEHIHDGFGVPYIPGSSIKGAIRTAVLSSLANIVRNAELKVDKTRNLNGKIQIKADAKKVEAELFGDTPNEDVFRFLQVGDAYFCRDSEVAIKMFNLNERKTQSFWDTSKPQLIEAIGPEEESSFTMKLNISGYEFARTKVKTLPDCMSSNAKLFETINCHTKKLLESEIEYWEDRETNDDSGKVGTYIEKIREVLSNAEKCTTGKECVLRVGHGSGWRFITGAWAENLDNFTSVVVPASRPMNHKYTQFDFPKTRRVDEMCELLGFVKLSD